MARSRMIRLDKTSDGVEVRCADCPHWYSFRFTMDEAHASASSHEQNAHPGDYRARNAAKMFARRHAVKISNV